MANIEATIKGVLTDELPRLFVAAEAGDAHLAIVAMRRLIAHLRQLDPGLANELNRRIFAKSSSQGALREEAVSAPTDEESDAPLLRRTVPREAPRPPVLSQDTAEAVDDFVRENLAWEHLLRAGLGPRQTMLLTGPPGVGKTMLAGWIASQLNLPFSQLELSAVVSSYLGRTGQNLREVFEYGRRHRGVILLDEFDAVAKRRDDHSDLGELKRVVSVLLKELEEWEGPSIIIAATNHPELIDPAIFRRFQLSLPLDLPDRRRAKEILLNHLGGEAVDNRIIELAGALLEGCSGSEIRELATSARRAACLEHAENIDALVLNKLAARVRSKKDRMQFCALARETLPKEATTYARLAHLLNVSKSTIHDAIKGR